MKKLIIIFFSAALGISFLFIGFGSYVSTNHVIKLGNTKITTNEFNEAYDSYKVENEISNLSEDQDLYAKIQFLNEYINELAYEEFLNEKIKISENSKKVILKKSLNNDELFKNLDETILQNSIKEIEKGIHADIFNNSLNAPDLVKGDIFEELLVQKNLDIYEIGIRNYQPSNSHEEEFFENYEIYKIELNNYDLKQYVEEELITSEIINQYFEENSEEFIEPKRYTYEQIISVNGNENDFNLLKENQENQFKLFEAVDEKLILPKVKEKLDILNLNEASPPIQIGEKYFYVKLNEVREQKIKSFDEVKEEINEKLIQNEIDNFDTNNISDQMNKYKNSFIFYSNTFNFLENIPSEYHFINFNDFDNSLIHEKKLIEYSVKNSDIKDLSTEIKSKFLESYDIYKEDIIQSHSEDELIKTGSVQVNYFTDSLTVKGFFLSEEDLENVVTIKENNLLKVSLPNEVIYLKVNEVSKIDPLNIKQNIVNLIYSTIINQIKNNYEIEVNNQEILNL